MEEAVLKRPIPLIWSERVRKLVTPSWETGRRRFGGRFSTRTKTADKTGWVPFPKRVEGRFGTRFRIFVYPSQGRFRIMCQTLSNGRQPFLKTGRGPFWHPSWKLGCARFQGRFSRWPERPTKRAGSRFQNGQRTVLGPVLEIGVRPF
jgi:hypothetical protein